MENCGHKQQQKAFGAGIVCVISVALWSARIKCVHMYPSLCMKICVGPVSLNQMSSL